MVAFNTDIVYYLVVPSGATSGTRVVIDGTNGVIDIFGPSSTGPNDGLVAQIGNGVGLTLFGSTTTMQLNVGSGVPTIEYWLNAAASKVGGLFAKSDGSIIFTGLPFNSATSGNSLWSSLFLANNGILLGFIKVAGGGYEGPRIQMQNQLMVLQSEASTTLDAYIQLNGNGAHSMYFNLDNSLASPRYLAMQTGRQVSGQPVLVAPNEQWLDLPLLHGWTNSVLANYYQGLRIRKDSAGTVFLTGSIVAPAAPTGTGSMICAIPGGFEPTVRNLFVSFYSANTPKLADVAIGSPSDTVFPSTVGFGSDYGTTGSGTLIVSCSWPGEF